MTDNKTQPGGLSVETFVENIPVAQMRSDTHRLIQIMSEETGEHPEMWGTAIVGFGTHHYKYESGREGETVIVGFSPRKQALTLYGVLFYDKDTGQREALGKYTTGKGCLYIRALADVDETILRQMIARAYQSKKQGRA